MEAKKKQCQEYLTDSGIRTKEKRDYRACSCQLSHLTNRTRWVVLSVRQMPINNLNFKSQLVLRTEKFSYAENNESYIYMLFKLYVQV